MRTWTKYLSDYGQQTNNPTNANASVGGIAINDSIRTICNLQGGKLRFLEDTKDMFTVANQSEYQIPNGFRKLIDMWIYSGSGSSSDTIYSPEMVFDPTKWKTIKQLRYGTSSVPYFIYVKNTIYEINPIPSTTGNLIHLRGRMRVRDLSILDYTTGSIVSIANGDTVIAGFGTTWTADMVGRYIQITETTAANGGDGFWYQIGSYTSATVLGLLKPYEGTSIVAGTAAYILGQCAVIPEAYDIAVVYRSTALYWQNNSDLVRANMYWKLYDGGNEAGLSDTYGGIIGQMLDNEGETEEGAYLPPFATTLNFPTAPYYFPYADASGF